MQPVRHGWLLPVAGAVAAIYFVHSRFDPSNDPLMLVEKGGCVGLLALWAALNARGVNGWLIAAVMTLGALGDVLIDAVGLAAGAAAFLFGHLVAIALYLRRWQGNPTWVAATAVVGALTAWTAFRIIGPDGGLALYVFALTVMTGTAVISRFPARVGVGAMLFFLSDWCIFLDLGPYQGAPLGLLIWPLYATGQMLIAHGVVTTLNREAAR